MFLLQWHNGTVPMSTRVHPVKLDWMVDLLTSFGHTVVVSWEAP